VPLLLSALPVFAVGLAEDLGLFASPRRRLLAAGASAALFVMLTGQWLLATDIPGLDRVLLWAPIGIAFSVFLSVGVSHAFNLIDGLNGLSSSTALAASLALAYIAQGADWRRTGMSCSFSQRPLQVFSFQLPLGKYFSVMRALTPLATCWFGYQFLFCGMPQTSLPWLCSLSFSGQLRIHCWQLRAEFGGARPLPSPTGCISTSSSCAE
jgi:UDP-N-acetylmuramyl pentapeptide phosphotransferase/UDP-N-acetylglucosamine-1-phosphate transferase